MEELEKQYELCNALYEEVIPKSLEFYLGVIPGMGDEEFMKGLLGGEGIPEEDDDDDEEESKPIAKKKKNKRKAIHSSK